MCACLEKTPYTSDVFFSPKQVQTFRFYYHSDQKDLLELKLMTVVAHVFFKRPN